MENSTHSCVNCTVNSLWEGAYNISFSSTARIKLSDILFFGGLDRGLHVTTGKPRHRQWHDHSKTKALIGQVHGWRAGSRRNIALEAIERGTARIPLGCHAEIYKSALIGQVRDTARYPAGITPSVNGPLGSSDRQYSAHSTNRDNSRTIIVGTTNGWKEKTRGVPVALLSILKFNLLKLTHNFVDSTWWWWW